MVPARNGNAGHTGWATTLAGNGSGTPKTLRDSSKFRPWLTIAETSKVQRHGQGIPLRQIVVRRRRGPWRWATGGKAEKRGESGLAMCRSDLCFKCERCCLAGEVRSSAATAGSSSKREHVVPLGLTCGGSREGSRRASGCQAIDSGGRCRAGRLRRASSPGSVFW